MEVHLAILLSAWKHKVKLCQIKQHPVKLPHRRPIWNKTHCSVSRTSTAHGNKAHVCEAMASELRFSSKAHRMTPGRTAAFLILLTIEETWTVQALYRQVDGNQMPNCCDLKKNISWEKSHLNPLLIKSYLIICLKIFCYEFVMKRKAWPLCVCVCVLTLPRREGSC